MGGHPLHFLSLRIAKAFNECGKCRFQLIVFRDRKSDDIEILRFSGD